MNVILKPVIFFSIAISLSILSWDAEATIKKPSWCDYALTKVLPHFVRKVGIKRKLGKLEEAQKKRRVRFESHDYENSIDELGEYSDLSDIESLPPKIRGRLVLKHFTGSPKFKMEFFDLLQDLEREVLLELLDNGSHVRQEALEAVLARYEEQHGFGRVTWVDAGTYKTEFYKMLRRGRLFNDYAFRYETRRTGSLEEHGYLTHRIQWHIVMRFVEKHPEYFEGTSAVELYKSFGDEEFNQQLADILSVDNNYVYVGERYRVENEGSMLDWRFVFDGDWKNFSSPEFMRKAHKFFPEIHWY